MDFKAVVSGHIYQDEKFGKDIEILTQIDNDENCTDAFCDITNALLDEIDTGDSEDYYFIAIVEAEFVVHQGFDYTEYDTEYYVKEIKSIEDLAS
jgi:hypothetical protein